MAANLLLLEVDEIKTIPCTPVSHPLVERLIGTVRREYLDRTFYWDRGYLERTVDNYKAYYNQHRCHTALAGGTPAERSGVPGQRIELCDAICERPDSLDGYPDYIVALEKPWRLEPGPHARRRPGGDNVGSPERNPF